MRILLLCSIYRIAGCTCSFTKMCLRISFFYCYNLWNFSPNFYPHVLKTHRQYTGVHVSNFVSCTTCLSHIFLSPFFLSSTRALRVLYA